MARALLTKHESLTAATAIQYPQQPYQPGMEPLQIRLMLVPKPFLAPSFLSMNVALGRPLFSRRDGNRMFRWLSGHRSDAAEHLEFRQLFDSHACNVDVVAGPLTFEPLPGRPVRSAPGEAIIARDLRRPGFTVRDL